MPGQNREGQHLGNYRLKKLLGKGGFAEVYLGEHIHLQAPAAVKVLNETALSEEDQREFLKEARIIRKLNHEHILKVLDFGLQPASHGSDVSIPYLVMDYAPDGTLRDRHPSHTTVPLDRINLYVSQVAKALQYAHDQWIVHCDVKPENMLVMGQDHIVISDFGIAFTGLTSNNPSVIQSIRGTLPYIAPERLEKGSTEPASDQYSLGIVVYEWLTSVRPFDGTHDQIVYDHIHTPPPPLYGVYNHVTPELEQVIMRALAKDPTQRYPSVTEFAAALSGALAMIQQAQRMNTPPPQTPPRAGGQGNPAQQTPPPQPAAPGVGPQAFQGFQGNPGKQQTPPPQPAAPGVGPQPFQGFQANPGNQQQAFQGFQANPSNQQQAFQGFQGNPGNQQQQAFQGFQNIAGGQQQAFQGNAGHQQQAFQGFQGQPGRQQGFHQNTPAGPQPGFQGNPGGQQQGQIVLPDATSGSSPNNPTQRVRSGQGTPSSATGGGMKQTWDALFLAVGSPLEWYGEFSKLAKFKAFRDAGVVLNLLSALLVGLLSQPPSPFGACLAAVFSYFMFFLCVHFVNPIISTLCGLAVAFYWGFVGLVVGSWLGSVVHPLASYGPFLGLILLGVSAYLHIYYVRNRLP